MIKINNVSLQKNYKDIMQLFCTQTKINKLKNNKSPQFLLGALIILQDYHYRTISNRISLFLYLE